jgi:metal-dependent amidase/aminoacylase/carboxypeptidase family protein
MTDTDDLKRRACDEVDRLADRLIDASHQIHAHPELNFEEVFAHDLLTDILENEGRAP